MKSDYSASPLSSMHFERVLLSAIHSLEEMVIVTDFDDRVLFTNKAFEQRTGWKSSEVLGEVLYRILLPEEEWSKMEKRNARRKRGDRELYELEYIRKDGLRRRALSRGTVLLDDESRPIGTVGIMADIDDRKRMETMQLYLQEEADRAYASDTIIGESPALRAVLKDLRKVAGANTSVLILGESGTGKELMAHSIHRWSRRSAKPLIKVNCAAIPKELFESEFFGHKKGSFTGAHEDKIGRFELAHEGTLFLDEVGELPLEQQGKLLRALQEKEIQRVGEGKPRPVDIRLVAATNRDLEAEVKEGNFREDLFYRLSVFPVVIPPLRDRKADILPLARHFVSLHSKSLGKPELSIGEEAGRSIESYPWPGNIRELQNVMERSVILSTGNELALEFSSGRGTPSTSEFEPAQSPKQGDVMNLEQLSLQNIQQLEKDLVMHHIERSQGRIYGPFGAAKALDIKPTTLQSKLKKWGFQRKWNSPT